MENEVKQLEEVALAWPACARAMRVLDQPTYERAANMLVDIAALERRIQEHHAPIKKAAFDAHRAAVAAEKRLLDPLQQARTILKTEIGRWEQEQERLRREAQRRAEEEQRRREEEARLALAVEAERNGASPETVNEIMETPTVLPPPVVAPTFQRVQGVSTQQRWKAQVFDLRALCRAVAEGRVSAELVQPNMTALNSMARAMKQTLNIPGVRAVPETTVAVRRAVV